jgi:hypothetical protein
VVEYTVREARDEASRELMELELVGVGLVTFPMQPRARMHAVGSNIRPVELSG